MSIHTIALRSPYRFIRSYRQSISCSLTSRSLRVNNRCIRLFATSSSVEADVLAAQIKAKGDEVRALKANNGPKDKAAIDAAVAELLKLKSDYDRLTGAATADSTKVNSSSKPTKANQVANKGDDESVITPRHVDYSAWYADIIAAADLVDQSPVRGCMVIKPWGMGVWDNLKAHLDAKIKETGTSNAYFPLFIPKSFLAKEAQHVDGFAKECAVVTHHRLCATDDGKDLIPDPDSKLDEPLIVRPTSETIIWHTFQKWISSHRDLPLQINQWANVVRWEMRTRPFLRTTEFLWQEGHTAHASEQEAIRLSLEVLDMYKDVCENFLAMPVIQGTKSPSERFAGAEDTYTIEALMQNGWALQSGTSHFLGQNFARAFDVYFQNEKGERALVHATSWGVSTRLLGALFMTHSDDKGVVLPPKVAPHQVVVVPILNTAKATQEDITFFDRHLTQIVQSLRRAGIRVKIDDRDYLRPGAKYFEWERKGVPLRIEVGLRDLQHTSQTPFVTLAVRHSGEKKTLALAGEDIGARVQAELDTIQEALLVQARARLVARTFRPASYAEMKAALEDSNKSQVGFYLVPWKCDAANEEAVKEDCKATIRCYPFEHNQVPPGPDVKCFYSGEPATHYALFARNF